MYFKRISALWRLLILLIFPIILSSCVNGTAQVKVRLNGTINLDLSVAFSKKALSLLGQSELPTKMKNLLNEKNIGAILTENNDNLELSVSEVIDTKNMSSQLQIKQENINVIKSGAHDYLFTRYDISADLNLIKILESETNLDLTGIPEIAKKIVESQMKFDLLLTTPIHLQNHNAALVKGKTLIWHINLFEPNHLQFSVMVPNVAKISFIAGIGLSIIILLLIIRVRISKTVGQKTKTSASFESEDKLH